MATRLLTTCARTALLLLAACGGTSTTDPPDNSMGNGTILAGTFRASLVPADAATGAPGYTSLVGKVYDGATPSTLIWTTASTSGACKLEKPRVPFCNDPCGGSAACVDDNKCQAYPTAKSVGTVKVTGMKTSTGATEFSMDPVANTYQPGGGVSLPFPAFSEGATVTLASGGGAYAPFTLTAKGIAPLTLADGTLALALNTALTLRWTPPAQAGQSRIYVKLDISHHGGTKGMIECDADDTGTLEIGAGLITDLLNLGAAGFPTITVARSATPGSTVIAPGRVELALTSSIERPVTVPGITSCTDDSECPMGKKCQADLTCK